MEPSALHSQIAQYKEQDKCLYFALGVAHLAAQIKKLVRDQAASTEGIPPRSNPGEEALPPTALLFFLLGLVSFSDRCLEILESFDAGQPGPSASAMDSDREPRLRLAIRDLLS